MSDALTANEEEQRYFFIHIQKTAGVSLRQHLIANLGRDRIYPPIPKGEEEKKDFFHAYLSGALVSSLPRYVLEQYLLFHGHLPFTASRRLPFARPLKTFTVLREPIQRTLSVLAQKKRHRPELKDTPFDEIYADPGIFGGQILNHQAKIFSVPDDSDALGGYAPFIVDEQGLARAKHNLESIDVIGLLHDMPGFLNNLARTFNWTMLTGDIRENVGRKAEVSQSLLDRIAEDNRIELEFYEHAKKLVAQRAANATPIA